MVENFKRITIFRMVALVGAVLMIIGVFPTYFSFEGDVSGNLIKSFTIGGIIILLAALIIVLGVAIASKVLSIIGACIGLVADVVFTFIMKTTSFYYSVSSYGDVTEGLGDLAEDWGLGDEVQQTIKEAFSLKVGFYLILIGAIIATAALLIDLIKGDKALEQKVLGSAGVISDAASSAASSVMANTANEYSDNPGSIHQKTSVVHNAKPWTCRKCGKENDGRSHFCVFCGQEKPKPKVCYNCGASLENHMMFCPNCGTQYDEEKANEMMDEASKNPQKIFCIYCGAELPEGASFCGKCGKRQ